MNRGTYSSPFSFTNCLVGFDAKTCGDQSPPALPPMFPGLRVLLECRPFHFKTKVVAGRWDKSVTP